MIELGHISHPGKKRPLNEDSYDVDLPNRLALIVDGMGGRVSGQPSSYAGMVFVFDAVFLSIAALGIRGPRILREVAPYWKTGIMGAVLSVGAYWIAIWAMTQAPIASVAALRETSILVVMLMSMRVLKETVTLPRLAGAVLIVAGAVLIRLA